MNRCILSLLFICTLEAHGDDWPQWRGPDRDGKSSETGLLDKWPAEGPRLLWQANDLGNGYSTPSVADGLVYVICNKDDSNEEVIALSLVDGTRVWSTRIGSVGANRGPQYPGTRSTPTVDGELVYALGSDGDLVCLDSKTGDLEWSKDLPEDFGGKAGMWAYTESPLVDGDALIVSPGGDATVVALDKSNGSLIWESLLPERDDASYSSPVVATINDTKQYVFFLSKGAVGLNAETGEPIWRYGNTSDRAANVQTPVVEGDFVYTAASRVGGGLVRLPGQGEKPEEVYFKQTVPKGMGGSVLVGDKLFGASGQTMVCVDFRSGELNWQHRSIGAASLCFAEGKLYLHGEDNTVAMVAANGSEYRELGRVTPPNAPDRGRSKAWTYPVIVDGKLIIRDVGTIWCYDIRG